MALPGKRRYACRRPCFYCFGIHANLVAPDFAIEVSIASPVPGELILDVTHVASWQFYLNFTLNYLLIGDLRS